MLKNLCLIVCVYILVACTDSSEPLLSQVTQIDANRIVVILGQNDIKANINAQKDGSYSVYVNKGNKLEALNILAEKGEPREHYVSLGDVFKKDSFISSPLEEQARLTYALNQEISDMLSMLNGVIDVKTRVSLPLPNNKIWQVEDTKPAVAVVIKYKQGERVNLYINRIKTLVSKAVPGVTPDQVEVLTVVQNQDN